MKKQAKHNRSHLAHLRITRTMTQKATDGTSSDQPKRIKAALTNGNAQYGRMLKKLAG